MIRVLFVCLGNICRSPMAKYVFKDMVNNLGLSEKFYIDSAATSATEIGEPMHHGTRNKLNEMNIPYDRHIAKQMERKDYNKFDYIIGMEEANITNIKRIVGKDTKNKIFRLLDFTEAPRDIADPWFTGNFDKTYEDIVQGLNGFISYLKEKNQI